jgi:hypothetical protein
LFVKADKATVKELVAAKVLAHEAGVEFDNTGDAD